MKFFEKIKKSKLYVKYPWLYEFTKFSIVGTIGALVDFAIYAVLTRGFDLYYIYATAISVFFAILNNFLLNKYWTFKKGESGKFKTEYFRFSVVSIINYFLNIGITFFVVEFTSLENIFGNGEDFFAKALAIGIVMFSNYFGNKFWTFKD